MSRISDIMPEVVDQISRSLRQLARADLAEQLAALELDRWTYDPGPPHAVYVYLSGQRPLNIVEHNVIGVRYKESIPLDDLDGMVVLDADNFDRITGIELLGRKDVMKALKRICPPDDAVKGMP